jgi:secondary thiamine-phosphate synthase enzyme
MINISSKKRTELIDITELVQKVVDKEEAKEGVVFLFVPHTTAGLTVNENADPSVQSDMIRKIDNLIPKNDGYAHSEGNSDSHLKSTLFGCEMFFIIENGKLVLGTWQGIYFAEFDGPRQRKLYCKITT